MEATLSNSAIANSIQATQSHNETLKITKTKSDSMEFVSGIVYLFKKVFLLG